MISLLHLVFLTLKIISQTSYESEYYYDSIFKMFIKSKKGLSFNILSFDCEYKNPKNFYPKLEKTLSFIRKYMTKKILINNTYDLWEYTIFLYKK